MACLQNTRKNSIVWPRDIADDPASLAFEAIETIIWKLPIAPVVRIVSKYFETTGTIRTIRTIIWKPGLRICRTNENSPIPQVFRWGYVNRKKLVQIGAEMYNTVMTPHKSFKIGLDLICKRCNPGQFKRIVWGHRSLTVVIFPHQFALTGWFIESGQSSSCSFWICQSIPCFLKFQFLWRHSYLVRWPRLCQLQLLGWMEIVWRRKTQNPKVTVTKSGSLEFPKLTSKRP